MGTTVVTALQVVQPSTMPVNKILLTFFFCTLASADETVTKATEVTADTTTKEATTNATEVTTSTAEPITTTENSTEAPPEPTTKNSTKPSTTPKPCSVSGSSSSSVGAFFGGIFLVVILEGLAFAWMKWYQMRKHSRYFCLNANMGDNVSLT